MPFDFNSFGSTSPQTDQQAAPTGNSTFDFNSFGTTNPDSIDTTPAPTKAQRLLPSFLKDAKNPFSFGNPSEDITNAAKNVQEAISGTGAFKGQSSIRRGFSAAESAATAIPNVVADVIPGGKSALNILGTLTDKGISTAANISDILDKAAVKAGLITPDEVKKIQKNDAAFADSPLGHAFEAAASVGNSAGNIANVVLAAHGTAQATQAFIDNKLPEFQAEQKRISEEAKVRQGEAASRKQAELVRTTADEIKNVEERYVKGRNANDYAKDGGTASRDRIAQSGVLQYAVDQDGLIRTTQPGGAVDQYRAMTIEPAEGVVRTALEREGSKTNITDIKKGLTDQVKSSGLKGADLVSALNGVEREIEGLVLEADANGYVPNVVLQDAKINTTRNINFQTPPETATYRKAIARGYKGLVEDNSFFNVAEVNAELAKYYDDLSRLERLDGARATGGKLGKYAAQISGNVVGAAVGGLFGPFGSAILSPLGGEIAKLVKGKSMQKIFDKGVKPNVPENPVLKEAVRVANSPKP